MSDINIKAKIEVENLGTLKQQLKEAQNDVQTLADKFGATSKEAIEAAKRAAELKDKIGDAKSLIDAFNPDAKFKALTSALSGAAGGFSAVQGAIGLMGVKSEEVEATLLKVNSAMALSEGLQSVGESIDSFKQLGAVITNTTAYKYLDNAATKIATALQLAFAGAVNVTSTSFKVLRVALISTGIGALVVAIGFAIEKIVSFTKSSDEATKKQKELNDQLAETTKSVIEQGEKFYDADIKLATARAKLRGASEKELFEIEQQGIKNKIKLRDSNYENLLKSDKAAATKLKEQNADDQDTLRLNKINFDIDEKKRETEKQKELTRIRKQAKQDEDQANEKLETAKLAARKAGEKFDLLVLDNKEKANQKAVEDAKKQDEEDNATMAANWELEETDSKKKLDLKNKQVQKDKESADNIVKLENEKREALYLTGQALNAVGEILGKQTAAGKALGTATALINTFLGITEIWRNKTTIPEPFGTIQKVAATAVAAASGFAAVKGIMRTQVPGGGGGGGGSVPSISTSAPISPVQMGTQLNAASIQGIGNAAAGGVNRAFVLEADINNSTERQIRLQRAARLG